MKRQARNDNPRRLQLLRELAPPTLNGIEYLEVASVDQRTLNVTFVNDHAVAALTPAHIRIVGGVRVTGVGVTSVLPIGQTLQVVTDKAGDFSWYELRLVEPVDPEQSPAGFDPCLSSIRFSFKAGCPSEFDCESLATCPPDVLAEPLIDYLAKDYASFRRLLLDRMGQLLPGGQERNPADFSVALVELLAHVGDQLSDYQDAVATEAYLGTARRRVSLRRHARLLDYTLHEGCNSRAFVTIDVGVDGISLPGGTPLLARPRGRTHVAATLDSLPDGDFEVFLTMHDQTLWAAQGTMELHTWGSPEFSLPKGATSAALIQHAPLELKKGAIVIFEETHGSHSALPQDVDRGHRQAVRITSITDTTDPMGAVAKTTDLNGNVTTVPVPVPLAVITWHQDDALTFPFCVRTVVVEQGTPSERRIGVARGNVVLVDHGEAVADRPLILGAAPGRIPQWQLPEQGLAFAQPYAHDVACAGSARAALRQDPRQAIAAGLTLRADDPATFGDQQDPTAAPWAAVTDLLDCDRFVQKFVVEVEHDGRASVRFGDNRFGAAPAPGARLVANYRIGGGARGNVGAETISMIVGALPANDIRNVRNPLPAEGGEDAESADAIRLFAPERFRTQERAVTEADHARMAERHPDVQRAVARLRWTGSWHTMFLTIDRRGGKPLDREFRAAIRRHMETYRLAGYDLEVVEPSFVALDVELFVCPVPGYRPAPIASALLRRLSGGYDAAGEPGFFHPDAFSFGDALPLSRLVAAAMSVAGVASVEVRRFHRYGRSAGQEIVDGILRAAPLEVLRLDNDPNVPENGRLVVTIGGAS